MLAIAARSLGSIRTVTEKHAPACCAAEQADARRDHPRMGYYRDVGQLVRGGEGLDSRLLLACRPGCRARGG